MKRLAAVLVMVAGACALILPAHAGGAQHYVVSSGVDDGYQRNGSDVQVSTAEAQLNQSAVTEEQESVLWRFPNIQLAQGETVSSATVTLFNAFGQYVGADWRIESGNCADLQTNPTVYGRTLLEPEVSWYSRSLTRGLIVSKNLAALFNAWAAEPTHRKSDAACVILLAEPDYYHRYAGDPGVQAGFDPRAFESGFPATLDMS